MCTLPPSVQYDTIIFMWPHPVQYDREPVFCTCSYSVNMTENQFSVRAFTQYNMTENQYSVHAPIQYNMSENQYFERAPI